MANSVLLDMNIVIAALRKDARVQQVLVACESIFIPATVVGELLYGAHNANFWNTSATRPKGSTISTSRFTNLPIAWWRSSIATSNPKT